jgi:hypothetical protein
VTIEEWCANITMTIVVRHDLQEGFCKIFVRTHATAGEGKSDDAPCMTLMVVRHNCEVGYFIFDLFDL